MGSPDRTVTTETTGRVAELADALESGSSARKGVQVQPLSRLLGSIETAGRRCAVNYHPIRCFLFSQLALYYQAYNVRIRGMKPMKREQAFVASLRRELAVGRHTKLAVSQKAGLSRSHLDKILAGECRLSLATADSIADALGCTLEEMIAEKKLEKFSKCH